MSWAAHEFENFALLKKFGVRTSYLGLLVGALGPDFLTKAWTYYGADNPAQFHRGWPGLGFTTSLGMAVIAAAITWKLSKRHKAWTWGVFIGWTAHALTDTFDTAGAMLFWPFWWKNISFGAWKYGAGQGKFGDAIAYYSSLGFAMDLLALVLLLVFAWRTLSRDWFETMVRPVDGAWDWIQTKFAMPDRALLAFYRGFFFYGFCRFVSWSIIVHAIEGWPFDLSWGSPFWVAPYQPW